MRVQAAERADWRAGEVQALVGLARGLADSPNAEDNTHDAPARAEALDSAITGRTLRGQLPSQNTLCASSCHPLKQASKQAILMSPVGHATTFR